MMRVFLACLLLLAFAAPAAALKISPFKVSVGEKDLAGGIVFRIENNTPESAAVQVRATTWQIAPDGSETNADAEDDFVIFPAQVVLGPHETRAVRVQYQGGMPAREKAYRLVAEQLPVKLKDMMQAGSAVRFMLTFRAALYITPPDARSRIAVADARATPQGLSLTLVNEGTAHAIIRRPRLRLALSGGGERLLEKEALAAVEGQNIHAGGTRIFMLPLSLPAAVVSARLESDAEF